MQKSFFFDAVVTDSTPDLTYSASDLATEKKAYFTDGVLSADGLTLTPIGGTMLELSKGAAVINGYTYVNTDTLPLSVSMGDSALDRIDLVVIRVDQANRFIIATVVNGTAAAHPEPPALAWTAGVKEFPVAQIYVPALSTQVSADNITDVRVFAEFAPDKNAKKAIVEEYLKDIITLTDAEKEGFDKLVSTVKLNGSGGAVLCGDGNYRAPENLRRVEIGRYTKGGNYAVDLSSLLSEGDLYDIVLLGGGGAGGCVSSTYSRGGGGGAGAYLCVSGVTLPAGRYNFTVGQGGVGEAESDGSDGGDTTFAGFFAPGGCGGRGGVITDESIPGGSGGEVSGFRGANGGDGVIGMLNESITEYGIGAPSLFGGESVTESISSRTDGTDAIGAGCGGGGGCCPAGTGLCRGGNGGDGMVLIYGYRRGLFSDTVA